MKSVKPIPACAFIFDLDGTLIDSLSGITKAMNCVLSEHSLPTHAAEDDRCMVGNGLLQLVKRALPGSHRHESLVTEFISFYRTKYEEIWPYETNSFAEIPDLLNRLTQQNNPFSVLSNKSHEVCCRMVSTLLSQFPFVDVLGQRPGIPLKPDPSAALTLTLLMNSEPENTFFVGDSAVDIHTAQNAGMIPIGVSWGMCNREELILNGAKHVIDTPLQLLETCSPYLHSETV